MFLLVTSLRKHWNTSGLQGSKMTRWQTQDPRHTTHHAAPAEGPPHPLPHPWRFDESVSLTTQFLTRFAANLSRTLICSNPKNDRSVYPAIHSPAITMCAPFTVQEGNTTIEKKWQLLQWLAALVWMGILLAITWNNWNVWKRCFSVRVQVVKVQKMLASACLPQCINVWTARKSAQRFHQFSCLLWCSSWWKHWRLPHVYIMVMFFGTSFSLGFIKNPCFTAVGI